MAVFRLENFAGIAPAKSARLLQGGLGQKAENMTFSSGRITPLKADTTSTALSSGLIQSIHFYERVGQTHTLFQFTDQNVQVLESPVARDTYERAYWTGDSFPRMGGYSGMVSGSGSYPNVSFRLGVPAPSAAPTVAYDTTSGTASTTEEVQDFAYVYTFVTGFGEEGPPSDPSTVITWTSPQVIKVDLPSTSNPSTSNHNLGSGARRRVYRANAGSSAAYFQLVADVPYTTTSITDNTPSSALAEVLPSEGWIGPPDDNTSLYPDGPMQGLIAVGNGVFCGFAGTRLCFSEPFLPHAWPIQYRITIENEIIGISATNNGVIVMTKGFPYFVTGTDPAAMTAIQVDVAQSCVNRNSIVDMGEYVLYAGPDGLVQVSNTTGQVISREFISVAQWNADFYPTSLKAFLYEGLYVAFWTNTSTTPFTHGGWIFDPRRPETAFSTFTMGDNVHGGFHHKSTGKLYYIDDGDLKEFQGDSTNERGYLTGINGATYKSRIFVSQPTSMGALKIKAQSYPVDFKVWADGTCIAEQTMVYDSSTSQYSILTSTTPSGATGSLGASPIARLPANHGTEWEVEVSSPHEIDEVVLASTVAELNA
tara:strand:- start:14040 stop:15821 length:1782 start_codon:yes stop_codon:yes gene_type:complete